VRRRAVAQVVALIALAGAGGALASVLAGAAVAHSNPCHTRHDCPSDHHTYVWTDLGTGQAWDCVEPGAPEYDPSLDTTVIVWDSLTYFCRSADAPPVTMTTTKTIAMRRAAGNSRISAF
jgi:hypothetical protein